MNILMLSSTFPYPPDRGGTEVRTFNLLKYLHRFHKVTLVTQRHAGVSEADVEALRRSVSNLAIFPLPEPKFSSGIAALPGKAARFLNFLSQGTPPNVLYRYSTAMQAWVDAQIHAHEVIACEHSVNEIYIRPGWRSRQGCGAISNIRTVVNIHSSVYGWTQQQLTVKASPNQWRDAPAARLRHRLYLPLLARYETRYCGKFDRLIVTTETDRQQLQQLCPTAQIAIVANGVDLQLFPYRPADPGGHSLVFVGAMDAVHNIDAARFFALEVMPHLRSKFPVTLQIVGARPTPEVLALAARPGIAVTGRVPAVAELLHRSTVCVVPLRMGLGIKNKTLEAMAAGIPIVGSDRGLEGLPDGAALRANSVAEYLEAIDRLFTQPDLRETLSRRGRSIVEQTYTWEQAGQSYERVLSQDLSCPHSL